MTRGSSLRRIARLVAYIAATLPAMPVQIVLLAMKSRRAGRFRVAYHRLCSRILGFRIIRHGAPASGGPVLFVANHTSYLDIVICGALLEASFIAKSEVARWPLFGWLAKLQRSVFV